MSAELVWDERLLTRERALELVGRWPIVVVPTDDEHAVHFYCAHPPIRAPKKSCGQSVGRYIAGYRSSIEDMLAGVLRHAVMAHELDLGGRDGKRQSPDHDGLDPGGSLASPALDRPGDKERAVEEVGRAERGDQA